MSYRTRLVVGLLWMLSLVGVGVLAGQTYRIEPLDEPYVLSGEDIGFRVEGMAGTTPTGRLVVRVDDRWVEPMLGGSATLVPAR